MWPFNLFKKKSTTPVWTDSRLTPRQANKPVVSSASNYHNVSELTDQYDSDIDLGLMAIGSAVLFNELTTSSESSFYNSSDDLDSDDSFQGFDGGSSGGAGASDNWDSDDSSSSSDD